MPRKRWSAHSTSAGWYSVIRGPRPAAEQSMGGLELRLAARGKVFSSAAQMATQHYSQQPDEVQAAARARVARVEEALKVSGEGDSTEVRGLQAALKEARRAAQDRRLAVQVEECQAFIQCSQRLLARLEEERAKEQEELDVALERLRAQVKEMETEREEARKKRSRSLSVPSPNLIGGPDLSLQVWGALHDEHVRGKGTIMETLTSRGSTLAASSNRFNPLA